MIKKLYQLIIILVVLSTFGTQFIFASQLNYTQINTIINLLRAFGVPENTVSVVQNILYGRQVGASTTTVTGNNHTFLNDTDTINVPSFCSNTNAIKFALYTHYPAVRELQQALKHLGYFSYPEFTDYYGNITSQAVQRFQCKHLSICSGAPESNGYGLAGPKTRRAICNILQQNTSSESKTADYDKLSARPNINAEGNQNNDCKLDNVIVKNGDSRIFYDTKYSADFCYEHAQTRTCNNGVLSGDDKYKYSSCKKYVSFGSSTPIGVGGSSSLTYSWHTGTWSQCQNGKQTRIVICKSSNGDKGPDGKCTTEKPATIRLCSSSDATTSVQTSSTSTVNNTNTAILYTDKRNYSIGDTISVWYNLTSSTVERNAYDYIALLKDGNIVAWKYLNDSHSGPNMIYTNGVVTFKTDNLDTGDYEIRLMKAATTDPLMQDVVNISLVYKVYSDATRHNAFPSVTLTKNGKLLVAFRSGYEHVQSKADAMLAESSDNGKTWTVRSFLSNPGYDEEWDIQPGSDITTLSNGTILVALHRVHKEGGVANGKLLKYETVVARSTDNGVTWTLSDPIDPYSFPYGRMIEKEDGSILLIVYGNIAGGGGLFRSTDDGRTWTYWGKVVANSDAAARGDDGATLYTETSILELDDNNMLAVIRGNTYGKDYSRNKLYIARSIDGGKSWSEPEYLFEGASPDLLMLPSGNILLCVADRDSSDGYAGVGCHISKDNGRSWSDRFMLHILDTTLLDNGYPSSVILDNGLIFTTFYANYIKDGKTKFGIFGKVYSEEMLK